jgi:4-amino-4-deoxy-L-arabinose transferase-like glycosyltransferase
VVTALIVAAVVALAGVHRWLTRRRTAWFGAVVPVLLLLLAGLGAVRGVVDSALEVAAVAFAGVVLLRMWIEGRQAGQRLAPAR